MGSLWTGWREVWDRSSETVFPAFVTLGEAARSHGAGRAPLKCSAGRQLLPPPPGPPLTSLRKASLSLPRCRAIFPAPHRDLKLDCVIELLIFGRVLGLHGASCLLLSPEAQEDSVLIYEMGDSYQRHFTPF